MDEEDPEILRRKEKIKCKDDLDGAKVSRFRMSQVSTVIELKYCIN